MYPRVPMKSPSRCLFSLLALILLTVSFIAAARRNIILTLDKKEIRDMTSSGLVLVFQIEVANASSNPYFLSQYDYRVVVEGTDLFAWRTALGAPIPVDKGDKTKIALPIKISYAEVFKSIPGTEGKTKLSVYATGLMVFTDAKKRQEKVPFAFSGEFPIFRDVEVTIEPIEVKALTIGGTEFVFSFSCRNPNDFELVPGKIAYRLDLDGKTAVQGALGGENTLGPGGERTFTLPVMLDFFEVGKEFFAIFDKPAAACRLGLEASADSTWGPIKLACGKAIQVPLKIAN